MLKARFLRSATRKDQYPRSQLPKIAFVGRSNVGKSSVINCLVGTKGLARTSSSPGRTQSINFFNVDEKWIFVDLPGYGFARVPAFVRDRWAPMIEEFLKEAEGLRLAVSIVDARHEPTEKDEQLIRWFEHFEVPYLVIANKIDKLSRGRRGLALDRTCQTLGLPEILPFSALTGEGRKVLWQTIKGLKRSKPVKLQGILGQVPTHRSSTKEPE